MITKLLNILNWAYNGQYFTANLHLFTKKNTNFAVEKVASPLQRYKKIIYIYIYFQ